MSDDPVRNPLFHNWTKAYLPYCDGSFHMGRVENPVSYQGNDLYFRGEDNTKASLNYLQERFDIYNADSLIVSGLSAGSIASRMWGNQIYHNSTKK